MIYIKQYGEVRTGTCYLCILLDRNFPGQVKVYTNGFGAKHFAPDYTKLGERVDELFYTVNIRDPYSWLYGVLMGVARGKLGEKGMFGRIVGGDYLTNAKLHLDMLRRFNRRYQSWKELLEVRRGMFVRHESLLLAPKPIVATIGQLCGLELQQFADEENEIYPGERVTEKKFDRKDFYLKKRYLNCMPEDMIRLVSSTIDWGLMAYYGYTKEKP